MSELPAPLDRLVRQLSRLPGVGRRSAQRIAFFLAREEGDDARRLAQAIAALPEELRHCERCGNLASEALCPICEDSRRDDSLLCVVEQPENLAAIERSGAFRGRYHVLGGAISPLHSIGPENLRIAELEERVREGRVREVVLATNPSVEGEATALFIARRLKPLGIAVSRPATGLPVGGDLDYVDGATLSRALEARRRVESEDE